MAIHRPLITTDGFIKELPTGDALSGVTPASIGAEDSTNKDASNGYVGKTLEKVNIWNAARTAKSFIVSLGSAARTWNMPDIDGTVVVTESSGITTLGSKIKAAFSSGFTTIQTNETNGYTALRLLPDGAGTESYVALYNNSDIDNSSYFTTYSSDSGSIIESNKTGTGITKSIYLRVAGNPVLTLGTDNVATLPYGKLKFPATQSASSDANTLDDYEEGTWTPQLYGGTVTGVASGSPSLVGTYTKIGRFVMADCHCYVPSWSTAPTGALFIGGFPFVNASNYASAIPGYVQASGASSTPTLLLVSGTNIVQIYITTSGTSGSLLAGNFTYQFYFSICYNTYG